MSDEPKDFIVHCGLCRHEWSFIKLPISIHDLAEKVEVIECPNCNCNLIYIGPAPAEKKMSDDLVKRLRHRAQSGVECLCGNAVCDEAADRIEQLEAALEDVIQYLPRADWHNLKEETLQSVKWRESK